MKKVLIYSHYFYPSMGGVERFTELLADGLSEKFDVAVMTKTELPVNQPERKSIYSTIRKNNLKYKEKPSVDMIVISGYSVKMILYAWLWRIPSIVIHHGDLMNCSNGTGLHQGLHCHHKKLSCFKFDLKFDGLLSALKKQLNLMTKKAISKFPKKHVFVSEWLKKATALDGDVIYNCFDEVFIAESAVEKKSQLIFAGRLVDIKGCESLINAYAKAKISMPLVICGDGPERTHLEQLCKNLLIGDKVDFKGPLSKENLAAEMKQSEVCVIPSINEEPFGLVAIEAAAARCIVIGRALGGLSEVCKKVGYKFSDDDELVELLQKADRGLLTNKSNNVGYFNCTKMMNQYIALIEKDGGV